MGANRKPHQIDGVGHGPGFIEVVDTPDKAAFDVAPGAEVFHMEITNRQDVRSFRQLGTNLRPELGKAVVSRAEEGEQLRLHARMLQAEIFFVEMSAEAQPFFKVATGFDYVHAGNDSDGRKRKSNSRLPLIVWQPSAQCLKKAAFVSTNGFLSSGRSSAARIESEVHAGMQAPQSMHSAGSTKS